MEQRLFNIFIVLISSLICLTLAETKVKIFQSNKHNNYFVDPANKYTWEESLNLCKDKKMELLTIETEDKSHEINELLRRIFSGKKIPKLYIGLNDLKEFRKFSWINGKSLNYVNWEDKEPNNFEKLNERCVNIGFHGDDKWNDINCNRKYGYICQETFASLSLGVPRA